MAEDRAAKELISGKPTGHRWKGKCGVTKDLKELNVLKWSELVQEKREMACLYVGSQDPLRVASEVSQQ